MAERIRTFDWAATPLGPMEAWSAALAFAVQTMLASPFAATLHVGRERILLFNDAYLPLAPEPAISALGRPTTDVYPAIATQIDAVMGRAEAGESFTLEDQSFPACRDGQREDLFFTMSHQPIRDDRGEILGVLVIGAETTARRRAETALRENETRSRLLIGSWAQAVWETNADGVVVADSPSWRAYTGQSLDELLGYGWLDAIHPDDRAYAERQWRAAMAAQTLIDAEFRLRAPDGG